MKSVYVKDREVYKDITMKKYRNKYTHIEGEALDIDEPPPIKLKKKVTELIWKPSSKFSKPKKWTLKANILLDIPVNANPLLILEGIQI